MKKNQGPKRCPRDGCGAYPLYTPLKAGGWVLRCGECGLRGQPAPTIVRATANWNGLPKQPAIKKPMVSTAEDHHALYGGIW